VIQNIGSLSSEPVGGRGSGFGGLIVPPALTISPRSLMFVYASNSAVMGMFECFNKPSFSTFSAIEEKAKKISRLKMSP
jgi:hypothetical protein